MMMKASGSTMIPLSLLLLIIVLQASLPSSVRLMTVMPVEAQGAPDCNCYHGAIESATPRCLCACHSGYYQPDCLYKADSWAEMEIWVNKPLSDFISGNYLDKLRSSLVGEEPHNITFAWARGSHNKTNALFFMSGEQARLFRYDVSVKQRWILDLKIESAYPYVLSSAPKAPFTQKRIIYSDAQVGEITIETIGWLIGAWGVVMFGVCVELCCSKNTEVVIYDLQDEGSLRYASPGKGQRGAAGRGGKNPFVVPGPRSVSPE